MHASTEKQTQFTSGAKVWAWVGGMDWLPAVVMKDDEQPIVRMEHGVWVKVSRTDLAPRDPELHGADRPRHARN
ncbi:MAG: hypothetical protein ACREQB_04480 [Candidatus Binataceae bacterium]